MRIPMKTEGKKEHRKPSGWYTGLILYKLQASTGLVCWPKGKLKVRRLPLEKSHVGTKWINLSILLCSVTGRELPWENVAMADCCSKWGCNIQHGDYTVDPWAMQALEALTPILHSQKSMCNFCLLQNLTTNRLLLTKSLKVD